MSPIDYIGTRMIAVRRVDEGIKITPLGHSGELILLPDEWEDLVSLAVLFAGRAQGIDR